MLTTFETAAPVLQEYTFRVRSREENGQQGEWKKTVDASSQGDAWLQVIKELKGSKMLRYVILLELVSTKP